MSKPPQSAVQGFQTTWNTLTPWARQQGISQPDIETVAQMDYNRLLNGSYSMSKDEAMSALLSLKQGSTTTTVPNQNGISFFSNPLESIAQNVQGIASGIFHLPETLFHQGAEAIMHPSSVYGFLEKPEGLSVSQSFAYAGNKLANAPLVNLIPFVSDVADLFSSQGRARLSDNPVGDILDMYGPGQLSELAEGAARAAGFDSAADLLARFPKHPLTTALKMAWEKAPELMNAEEGFGATSLGNYLGTKGTSFEQYVEKFLQSMGWTRNIRERILRPFATARQELSSAASLRRVTAQSLVDALGPEEQGQIAQVMGILRDPNNDVAYNWSTPETRAVALEHVEGRADLSPEAKAYIKQAVDWSDDLQQDFLGHPQNVEMRPVRDASGKIAGSELARSGPTEAEGAVFQHPITGDRALVREKSPIWKRLAQWQAAHDGALQQRQMADQLRDAWQNAPRGGKTAARTAWRTADAGARKAERAATKAMESLDRRWKQDSAGNFGWHYESRSKALTYEKASEIEPEKFNEKVHIRRGKLQDQISALEGKATRTTDENRYLATLRDKLERNQLIREVPQDPAAPGGVDEILQAIFDNKITEDPTVQAWVNENARAIREEVLDEIQRFRATGRVPLFVPKVTGSDLDQIDHPSVSLVRKFQPNANFEKKLVMDTSIHDTMIGLTFGHVQILQRDIQRAMIPFIESLTKTRADIAQEANLDYRARYGKPPENPDAVLTDYLRRNYKTWNPETLGGVPAKSTFAAGTARYIRASHLDMVAKTRGILDQQLKGTWDKAMGVFRFSILGISLRYAAHITLGGSFFLLAEVGPEMLVRIKETPTFFRNALQMTRDGGLPDPVSLHVSESDMTDSINSSEDAVFNTLSGKTSGRMLRDSFLSRWSEDHPGLSQAMAKVVGGHEAYMGFLNNVSEMQRALAYLYGESYAMRKGASNLLSGPEQVDAQLWGLKPYEYYGVKIANRILGDMKAHSPIERWITRVAVPFYGWTRHVIRYTLKFPYDHPLRASIVTNLAQTALTQDQQIPDYYYRLFFLGQPNQLGNTLVDDTRQWNPVRDVANYFTLQGIIQTLNPLAQGLLSALPGASQDAELYPSLTYNDFYGSLQNTTGNAGYNILGAFIPQTQAIAGLLSTNSQLAYDRKFNPSKFWYDLADQVGNFPWVPYQFNTKEELAKEELAKYDQASQAAQSALSQDNPALLAGYGPTVPYEGWNISPDYLSALIRGDTSQFPESELLALRYPPRGALDILNSQGQEENLQPGQSIGQLASS